MPQSREPREMQERLEKASPGSCFSSGLDSRETQEQHLDSVWTSWGKWLLFLVKWTGIFEYGAVQTGENVPRGPHVAMYFLSMFLSVVTDKPLHVGMIPISPVLQIGKLRHS